MRIREIKISRWRNFREVNIEPPADAPLVCLVGANGSGKSHILELISAAAHHVGLSSGIDIPRGDPFKDLERDFTIEFYLAKGVSAALDRVPDENDSWKSWDRTILIHGADGMMRAGGLIDDNASKGFTDRLAKNLRSSE